MAHIISEIRSALRPVAKEIIKGGLIAVDAFSEFVAETGEQIKDLVAEAKAELAKKEDGEKTAKADSGHNNGVHPSAQREVNH